MQLYECTVRLNGQLTNEVHKTNVTAAEIAVLRALHGGPESGVDVVIKIKPTGHANRDDTEERSRLQMVYGRAIAGDEHLKSLQTILGHHTAPLPQTVPGVDSLPSPKSGRRAKPKIDPVAETTDEPASEAEPIQQEEFA